MPLRTDRPRPQRRGSRLPLPPSSVTSSPAAWSLLLKRLRLTFELLVITMNRFVLHDAWAIASHIALSVLTSFFPFLILITALASVFGTGTLADEVADLILEAWPQEISG